MTDQITDFCTGCRACEQLCAKHAILMKPDKEGFLTATINNDLCIDCGVCKKRCPQNKQIAKQTSLQVLAVRLKDDELLSKSASGSVLGGIAESWIKAGGVVVGVVYDNDWHAKHICVSKLDDLFPLLSSKYVQSDTGSSFSDVKCLLQEGRFVLYSGTSCQIAGLKAFLRKDYDNLFTMDLICHGVSSPLLFREYIKWLEKKCGFPISEYNFRDKSGGWGLGYKYKYKYNNTYKCSDNNIDPYYSRFLEGSIYRECCYNCHYCTSERIGDITIGDYWGIEKEHPDFYDTKGVSCMLINTEKGRSLWEQYKDNYHFIDSSFDKVARHNGNLLRPTKRVDVVRDVIYSGIGSPNWFENVFVASFKPTLKSRIKALLPMWLRLLFKKLKY